MSRADAERLATMHLPILQRFDRALYEELLGIADGADARPEDIVVLNHYTDLRDLDPRAILPRGDRASSGAAGGPTTEDGCSALWALTTGGPILAQTWDMHASALPYVMLLELPETDHGPGGVVFTLTGCLGMCGLNQDGVGITINNLSSTDARIGLVWPALVRRVLREADAIGARDTVRSAPLGSGHHYLVADPTRVFALETSGARRKVVFAGETPSYVHTNHCLDPEIDACSRVPPGSTTFERYDRLAADLEASPVRGVDDAYLRLGSHDGYPRSICANLATPERPHLMATCGAIAIDLAARTMLAVGGFPHNVAPERIELGAREAP
jgi:isopenicillin-N N-acyltransferase-like protein